MKYWFRPATALVIVTIVVVAGVSSAGASAGSGKAGGRAGATPRKPGVAAATLEGPITVGEISPPVSAHALDFATNGYTEEEFFASGTATTYTANGELSSNGRWKVTPAGTAPYKTRFVVRRPQQLSRFNGTVVAEWLNVTVVETDADWSFTGQALMDEGAAWVGVSAQALGVVGGQARLSTGTGQEAQYSGGIRTTNPTRYGSLIHPGDQYSFDIFSQVAAALRSPGKVPVFGGRRARKIVAAGESQSAGWLSGYINAFQPITHAFDGFLVHSRGAGAAQPDGARPIGGTTAAYWLRTDLDVPVMVFETETDVGPRLRYALAAQPDTRRLRVWETAGTSHADAYFVGKDSNLCPGSKVNDGPHHYVVSAAMAALLRWVETGKAPAHAPRIQTGGPYGLTVARDEHGIALGGIRTPSVDVPVETLSGESKVQSAPLCGLFGSRTDFDSATLASLYPTKDAYLAAFDKSLDRAIKKGFIRRQDRTQYAAEARAFVFPA